MDNNSIDYKLVCRTCLASEAEFYKLDARLFAHDGDDEDGDENISLLQCLQYCTNLEDMPEFPMYICTECSAALQVAYNFMKNALEAHEILRQKLPLTTRINGQLLTDNGHTEVITSNERKMIFRCKICGEKIETRKSRKEHVKSHLNEISYICELCSFQTKKRSALSDHYMENHGVQPSKDQLKLRTAQKRDTKMGHLRIKNQCQQQVQMSPQPMNVAQYLSPPTMAVDDLVPTELQNFDGGEINLGDDVSIGNEFVVMDDGSVQEVMENGVVIKYISTGESSVALDNGIYINNITLQPNVDIADVIDSANDMDTINIGDNNATMMDVNATMIETMDFDDIIEEEEENTQYENIEENNCNNGGGGGGAVPVNEVAAIKQIRCKMCKSIFSTQEELKEHMLTHNEIPHFFCENCDFYTFFKIDLTQHYKTKHKLQPNNRQLLPKNKVHLPNSEAGRRVYVCEMCLYETPVKTILRRHFLSKHQMEATEMQLRPMRATPAYAISNSPVRATSAGTKRTPVRVHKRDYRKNLRCMKCNKIFHWQRKLDEHYVQEHGEEKAHDDDDAKISAVMDVESLGSSEMSSSLKSEVTDSGVAFPDAIPHAVGVDNDNEARLDLDFNGDAIFEDDDDDDDNGDDDDDDDNDDDDDDEDGEENRHQDNGQDLLMTTDDEREYAMEKEQSSSPPAQSRRPFCSQCKKEFSSYYQFENHMFVHRGLAPYRCEMCTNLYITKRELIRHYRAVHKLVPTRDMVQAKGEKGTMAATRAGHEIVNAMHGKKSNAPYLMCVKCPFECADIPNMRMHLNTVHVIDDDSCFLRKLAYECPKCIRCFDSSTRLSRHLSVNHSHELICYKSKMHNDKVICTRCGVTLMTTEIKSHRLLCNRTVISTSIYHCPVCDASFESRKKLLLHKAEQHSHDAKQAAVNSSFFCKFCPQTCTTESALKDHLKTHIACKYICAECPKYFQTQVDLEEHKLTHNDKSADFVCETCNKRFQTVHQLKRHKISGLCDISRMAEHQINGRNRASDEGDPLANADPVYNCKLCSTNFHTQRELRQHTRNLHKSGKFNLNIAARRTITRCSDSISGASSSGRDDDSGDGK